MRIKVMVSYDHKSHKPQKGMTNDHQMTIQSAKHQPTTRTEYRHSARITTSDDRPASYEVSLNLQGTERNCFLDSLI